MATLKNDEPQIEEIHKFLDELRDSGGINMFEAGPHLQDHFKFTAKEARKIVLKWMKQKT
jgi:hypothetical protein